MSAFSALPSKASQTVLAQRMKKEAFDELTHDFSLVGFALFLKPVVADVVPLLNVLPTSPFFAGAALCLSGAAFCAVRAFWADCKSMPQKPSPAPRPTATPAPR